MKFAVAVGVLSQTLPALSEQARNFVGSHWDKKRGLQELMLPSSREVSKMSQTNDRHHWAKKQILVEEHPVLHGHHHAEMKNLPGVLDLETPCDPSSSDADVGILSCGEGRFCKPTSDVGGMGEMNSELGGLCVTEMAESRHLQTAADICDPSSPYFDSNCDCSGFVDGVGTISCLYDVGDYLCEAVAGTSGTNATFDQAGVPSVYSTCLEFTLPYYQKLCVSYNYGASSTCSVAFNGVDCSYCGFNGTDITSVDCTNAQGGEASDPFYLVSILNVCYGTGMPMYSPSETPASSTSTVPTMGAMPTTSMDTAAPSTSPVTAPGGSQGTAAPSTTSTTSGAGMLLPAKGTPMVLGVGLATAVMLVSNII